MNTTSHGLEKIISEYIGYRQHALYLGRKRNDAEKEYNKLLTKYNGEAKLYNLEQADKIYSAYLDMIAFSEESKIAELKFFEAEEKLKEIGRILFDATITADIMYTPVNGEAGGLRPVTITYNNGQVIVS